MQVSGTAIVILSVCNMLALNYLPPHFVFFLLADLYILQVYLNKWRLSKSRKFSSKFHLLLWFAKFFYLSRYKSNHSPCGETNSLVTLLVACRTMYLLPSEKGPSWRDRGDRHFGCWTQAHNHQLVPLQNYLKPSKYWSWSVDILLLFAHIFVLYLLWFVPAHNTFLSLSFYRKKLLVVICATHTKQICPCPLFIVICASTHHIFVFVLP